VSGLLGDEFERKTLRVTAQKNPSACRGLFAFRLVGERPMNLIRLVARVSGSSPPPSRRREWPARILAYRGSRNQR
jgi:hypothetical protein